MVLRQFFDFKCIIANPNPNSFLFLILHRDLTSAEALRLASTHNNQTHKTRKTSFYDKVKLARTLFFEKYELVEGDDVPPPTTTRDGRRQQWKVAFGQAMGETDLSKAVSIIMIQVISGIACKSINI